MRVFRPRPVPRIVRQFPVIEPTAAENAYEQRWLGLAKTGFVGLRNFDQGLVETTGAYVEPDKNGQPKYWLKPGRHLWGDKAEGLPEMPGVPVVFANPEDVNQDMKFPFVLVTRADISPDMERWSLGYQQYRAPADGAVPFTTTLPNGAIVNGYDRMEIVPQAIPYNITYSITIKARFRGAPGQRNQVNGIFEHILRKFPPYGTIDVVDSIGDLRKYQAFNESVSNLDSITEVQDRVIGFQMLIRVEAELDLNDPYTAQTVRKVPAPVFNPI